MVKKNILKFVFLCSYCLVFSACSAPVKYDLVVKNQFPNYTPIEKKEFCLELMKGELAPEELDRIIKHPQYIETDINFDGKIDFAYLAKKRHSNRTSLHLISCLNEGNSNFNCSIIGEKFSTSTPFCHYLDSLVLNKPSHYCDNDFPTNKELFGFFPTLGCCFTVYYYDNNQKQYKSCNIGD